MLSIRSLDKVCAIPYALNISLRHQRFVLLCLIDGGCDFLYHIVLWYSLQIDSVGNHKPQDPISNLVLVYHTIGTRVISIRQYSLEGENVASHNHHIFESSGSDPHWIEVVSSAGLMVRPLHLSQPLNHLGACPLLQ